MADLFERLFIHTDDQPNISVHVFWGALCDYVDGQNTTRAEIIALWELDAEAQADLHVLCDALDAAAGAVDKLVIMIRLHTVMLIAEQGLRYNTRTAFRNRLGL